jgi:hypothetical protein
VVCVTSLCPKHINHPSIGHECPSLHVSCLPAIILYRRR